jgi:ferredoxin
MNKEIQNTNFRVDEQLCIGCGKCIDACPMHILEIKGDICVMTKSFMCLECGSCMRECPEDAIEIDAISDREQIKIQEIKGDVPLKRELHFTPILKRLTQLVLKELHPVQLFDYQGMHIADLNEYEIEGKKCYSRLYKTDKTEKISVASTNFFGQMCADVMVITPTLEYDFPFYVMDWDESEDHIFFICDLMPSDDPGRNSDYLSNYLHNHLDDLYLKYCEIPGLKNSVFHWVRAIQSPYMITGTVEKNPKENVALLFNCAVDYLKAWIRIYKEAKSKDPQSEYMQLIHERRGKIRDLYLANDPGGGAINKFLGEEKAKKAMAIIVP